MNLIRFGTQKVDASETCKRFNVIAPHEIAKSYFPFMKATYEEIKAADPDARVIGLSVTEDFGVKTGQFVKEMLQAGGAKYMDIASFHPYTSRELSSIAPADAMIAEFRQLFAEAGDKNKPIWNTELYYLIDQQVKHDSYEEGLIRPHHIAMRFLIDLGEGVVQSISVHENQL